MINPLFDPEAVGAIMPKLFLQISRSLITDKAVFSTENFVIMNQWHIKSPGFSNLLQMNVPSHVNTITIMNSANRTRKEVLMMPVVSFHYDRDTIIGMLNGKGEFHSHCTFIYGKIAKDKPNFIAIITPPNMPDDMSDTRIASVFLKMSYKHCQNQFHWFSDDYGDNDLYPPEVFALVADL